MAPHKLTNVCLESILRNKAPVELQAEVKEITTDESVQELLQKLLRAEAVIQEQKQWDEMGVQGQAQHGRNSQWRKCTETPKQEAVQRSDRDTGSMNPSTETSDEMILSQSNVLIAKRKATLPRP